MIHETPDKDREHAEHEARIATAFDAFCETSKLSTDLLMYAVLRPQRPDAVQAQRDIAIVDVAVTAFEDEVWYGGLQKEIQSAKTRGLSVRKDNFEALLFSTAGRFIVTLRDKAKKFDVTLITAEDEPKTEDRHRMGIQGIYATAPEAVELIHQAIQLKRRGQFQPQPDPKIRLF